MTYRITYILHYELPDGSIYHYVGGTTPDRIKERMKEHRKGKSKGSSARLRRLGGYPRLAGVYVGHSEAQDKFINGTGGAAILCTICGSIDRKTEEL
jgi:hypothetical protein